MENINAPHLIVGIGASAGGLDAIEKLFQHMPTAGNLTFIVVQHLSPDFKSLMDELLARRTSIPIQHAIDGALIQSNTIYLNPPKKDLTLSNGRFRFSPREERQSEMPIDIFFRSLAEDAGEKAVAIVLSGTGSDGSRGIREIHAVGGLVIVQDPETCQFDGMPRNAIASDAYDFILPPEEIPDIINQFATNPLTKNDGDLVGRIKGKIAGFDDVVTLLRRKFGLDFSQYKTNTARRRMARRMVFLDITDVGEYAAMLTQNDAELEALYHDMLIGVTDFFRDTEAFAIIEKSVLPEIFLDKKNRSEELRIWSVACSTGEEAYSLAILLFEAAREHDFSGKISIFATDVHRSSIEAASANRFTKSQLKNLSPERMNKYFLKDSDGYFRLLPEIREMIVFAVHNVLKDPPFTRMDLIVCRNFLIYLQTLAQDRVLALFHFALKPNRFLFLGSSEGLGRLSQEFDTKDSKWKIFKKIRDAKLNVDFPPALPGSELRTTHSTPLPFFSSSSRAPSDKQMLSIYATLLQEQTESGFLVGEDRTLLHTFGNARDFLTLPSGRIDNDILSMLDGDLRLAVSTGLQRALQSSFPVFSKNIPVSGINETVQLDISFRFFPALKSRTGFFQISFQEQLSKEPLPIPNAAEPQPASEPETGQALHQHIYDLEQELKSARENLQALIEELQTTNEELQATNEELLAANEELQSTNEELHSVNEELYTVNAEYERKNRELHELNLDHDHLLQSMEVGTLFLDEQLRVRKFNSALKQIFNLLPQDIGRPIVDIAYQLEGQAAMLQHLREVLSGGQSFEREIACPDGTWYIKKIVPYYSSFQQVGGAILTFTNITQVKRAQLLVAQSEERFRAALHSSLDPFFILQAQRDITGQLSGFSLLEVNQPAELFFQSARDKLIGLAFHEALAHPNADLLLPVYGSVFNSGAPVISEIELNIPHIDARWIRQQIVPLRDGVAVTLQDVSARHQAEQAGRQAKELLEKRVSERTVELTDALSALQVKEDRYRAEIDLATQVQAAMLNSPIANDCFEVATLYVPFNHVSGDSYWSHWDPLQNKLFGYIVDVSGHGLSTALQTAAMNVLFRQAFESGLPLDNVLSSVNARSGPYLQDAFAAAICFVFDFNAMTLEYAVAGINYFIASSNSLPVTVKVPGSLIGIREQEDYEKNTVAIQSGECFYFMTDGLFELLPDAESLPLRQFDRTLTIFRRFFKNSPREEITDRHRGLIAWDDATAFCVKVK